MIEVNLERDKESTSFEINGHTVFCPLPGHYFHHAVISQGVVVTILSRDNGRVADPRNIYAYDANGKLLWSAEEKSRDQGPTGYMGLLGDESGISVQRFDGTYLALDPKTGQLIGFDGWSR